jgi:hypothetical protein
VLFFLFDGPLDLYHRAEARGDILPMFEVFKPWGRSVSNRCSS